MFGNTFEEFYRKYHIAQMTKMNRVPHSKLRDRISAPPFILNGGPMGNKTIKNKEMYETHRPFNYNGNPYGINKPFIPGLNQYM